MADEALVSCVATLSAVFILGGDITRAQNREHLGGLDWRSLRGLEEDKTGPMPSYERVEAGSCLHRMNPSLLLIPSGGKSNLPTAGDSPPIATVMAAELRELGVASTAIIEETQSFTTQEHFVHCSAIARARRWNSAEIGILAPSGATDTLTITLSNGGTTGTLSGSGLSGGTNGVCTLAAAAAATITSELDALVFTPKAGAPTML